MKFTTGTIAAFASILSFASADHIQEVVCTDVPTTVYKTVTVTAGAGGNNHQQSAPATTPYVVTAGPTVTSVDYSGDKTSVWVYPTGTGSKDCTVAIYEKTKVTVVIININVTIINGVTTTITSTKSGVPPTYTPTLPPTPPVTTTTTPPPGSTTYPPGAAATHTVIVGADGLLKYRQEQVNAAIGDIIRFDFNSTNHTVTQSSFNEPCKPLAGGFSTGFNQFNPTNQTGKIFRDFKVEVSTPLWFYCAQTVKVPHCSKGMVFAVNPAGKFDAFLSKATATAPSTSTSVVPVGPSGTAPGSSVIVDPTFTAKPTGTGAYPKSTATGTWSSPAIKATPVVYRRRAAAFAA
ncbi:hypothetical protein BGZ60DRAFT_522026 [Tricladium varicosporioides]|nr:hypothetical protein BGZ60DRAFT_522026 [Hymenoscyphus varicosporioides]